ncbi:MAG: type II toxin-antitoxin system VapC family toxin [Microscillaceae bacterium]|jgi:predicted nucleic acid-binding protein|nr:type II toxin-antitoxin system VapC family toxin [Microscillaceae bacterium]
MDYLLDTNILLKRLRQKTPILENEAISIVSHAEIWSLAIQFGWGQNKLNDLHKILSRITIINLDATIVGAYVDIDTFSQGKHPSLHLNGSARNMGKNDIWIAATAHIEGLTLWTDDADFDHLSPNFIQIKLYDL